MFRGISRRLILYYMVVIAAIVIMMGIFFAWFLNYYYRQILQDNLYIQARLAAAYVEEMIENDGSSGKIDAFGKELGRELGLRFTLVDGKGNVLADSDETPAVMDNHSDRPEIIEALIKNKGVAVRYSVTLDEEMYYVAVPLKSSAEKDKTAPAVIRLALPMTGIREALSRLFWFIAGALVLSFLAALAIAMVLSNRITGPIADISRASETIASGNYNPPLEVKGRDELADLAESIKKMGKTLKIRMNQVLREKNKLETVVSSLSGGIILLDRELNVELINPAAEKIFELEREKVSGKAVHTVIRNYTLHENLKAAYRDGEPRVVELNLYYPYAAVLESYIIPIWGSEKEIIGILLLFQEVTALRSIEKMRSDFVANISHELRTPLTAVRGYTETIMHEDLNREQLYDFIKIIDRETERLSSLLDDLLDLAQIENEKGFMQKGPLKLAAAIDEAIEQVGGLKSEKNATILFEPESAETIVEGNSEWLRQALANVIENSIRHGSVGGKVKIRLLEEKKQAVVEISDNGPGISDADLPYVFERFYRVDKARSRKSGGTGLGLSIVKHIMEAHNAAYSMESVEGKGTLFRFRLPLIDQ